MLTHSILNSANRKPDHIAFSSGSSSITYAQLADRMNQLALLLIELGVKKGDRVGIYLHRGLETAIAIYGILRSGAVYVPLDPNAPATRTKFVLEDCQIEYLISHSSRSRFLKKVVELQTSLKAIIGVDGDWPMHSVSWDEVANFSSNRTLNIQQTAQDLAYILYTSGSTGEPKGIMHTHYSGLSYAQLTADTYQLNGEDRFGNHSPIHFDISTLGYFTAPMLGASTVIVPDAHTKMPASLSQLMEQEKISVWYSVPLALIQLLHLGVIERRDLSSLRWVLFAGETFPTKYLKSLMQMIPQAHFSNIYGPAETNQCTYYNMSRPPLSDAPIPLGHTWQNTEMLILDTNDQEVPVGEQGELLIRSATMMAGYWRRPELTQKSLFVQDLVPGRKTYFYRTGDLIKLDEEGLLHFLGRKDQQVKVRGYRVELEAVEHALSNLDEIEEAVVFAHRNKREENVIIGVAILQEENDLTEKEILQKLRSQLPHYAIPDQIFFVDAFPRTGTEKIDRLSIRNNFQQKIEAIYG